MSILTSSTVFNLLKQVDSAVWKSATRRVQGPWLPVPSRVPVNHMYGSLYYRSVYYYSVNPDYPYVRMIKSSDCNLPLVACCTKSAYEAFLKDQMKGVFDSDNVVILVPRSYLEEVCDL